MTSLTLTVRHIDAATPQIRTIELQASDGSPLPSFEPGAHIDVHIPGETIARSYSLVSLTGEPSDFHNPERYRLGIRLEETSAGGSRYMHALSVNDVLSAGMPKNDFPLHQGDADDEATVLLAGGIGITPIASMAARLRRQSRPYVLHYFGRSRSAMAFMDALQTEHGDKLQAHIDDETDTLAALNDAIQHLTGKQHLYVCGPKGFIDAALALHRACQRPDDLLHFELFTTAQAQSGDQAFEVELRQSGLVLQVPADKTILQVLEENGCDPMYDCRRGECGVCQVDVLEGIPDHRDYYLSPSEREENNVIHVCISRSRSARLVLDL